MAAIIIELKEDILYTSPAEMMEKIIHEIYPSLFAMATELVTLAGRLSQRGIEQDLGVPAEKIFRETDALYRKEKLVLFPFIAGLLRDLKRSESCTPFKNVKMHYTALLALLRSLRLELEQFPGEEKTIITISSCMDDFEKKLIGLQLVKDKYLFTPLRSCTGCKRIG